MKGVDILSYNNWLSAKDIPTIRRLDYIVEGTDNMESGYLYAVFRRITSFSMYNNVRLTDKRKDAQFEFSKKRCQERATWINDWMIAHNREIIFTDINSWRALGADYDYFWELRTKDQFAEEEAKAILGLSNRTPVNITDELSDLIEKYVEILKKENISPT